jgi:DNA-binding MarR family transcriptional regulator
MNADFQKTLPFMMFRLTANLVGEANGEFSRFGLNVQGARLLIVARQNPNIRVGELAEITCVEGSTLSHMLRRMERDGLLERRRSKDDNRSVTIVLTARGIRVAEAVHAISTSHQRMMLTGLTATEIKQFRSIVEKLGANIQAIPDMKAAARVPSARKRKTA